MSERVGDSCWATLPAGLQSILEPHFRSSLHLQAAFDDLVEAHELLRDIVGGNVDEVTLEMLATDLDVWRTSSERGCAAARQRFARSRLSEPRLPARAEEPPAVAAASAFQDFARRGVKLERRTYKSSGARALAAGEVSRRCGDGGAKPLGGLVN